MEDTFADAQKNGQDGEDSLHSLSKEKDLSGENKLDCSRSNSNKLTRRASSPQAVILNVKQLQRSKSCVEDSLLQSVHVLENLIPKYMVTVDEKYLRSCLEVIQLSASRPAPCNVSLNRGGGDTGLLSESFGLAKFVGGSNFDLPRFEFDSSLPAGNGSMVINPAGEWIVGSIMGSKSMMNILKSPLLQQHGAYDGDSNFEKGSFSDVKGSGGYSFMSSPGGLSDYSLPMLDKGAQTLGEKQQGSQKLHERLISTSSTNSTCSDHSFSSSSSVSATVTQGMLQCSWKGGKPHFTFSLDEQKVVYEAKLLTNVPTDDKAMDHMYVIHSRMGVHKERAIHDNESHLVGKVKVSTSFTLCPNNSRIMEREFVLFGLNGNAVGELETSSHEFRKSKGLSKKVSEVFRSTHSFKRRTVSKFGGSSAILENSTWEPVQDADHNTDALPGANLLVNLPPPSLELAAIIVKDHIPEKSQEKVGGWGLKFLNRAGAKQTADAMESSTISSSCSRDSGDCSTSMDVLIPAGLHGGPRTRNGGPSSLIERWRSGGCDCGGWDLGCPLTLFKSRSNDKKLSSETDAQGQCKLIDLFIQGSDKSSPPLRMVNVHNGLYFVNFQSTLSDLQAFSIALAFIHCQSPALRPKSVKDLK
ncbi:hypothetical protein Tsubulata_009501 [Turnera subulata]|uniref:Uncharacterized protein n=1 Tax=Turnera subulata TaxID=218843 RepID=A0A9Q0J4G4_9ROSI|nr:hypothetical protein Tsubulata_009501 [Turnera subulata]